MDFQPPLNKGGSAWVARGCHSNRRPHLVNIVRTGSHFDDLSGLSEALLQRDLHVFVDHECHSGQVDPSSTKVGIAQRIRDRMIGSDSDLSRQYISFSDIVRGMEAEDRNKAGACTP